MDLHEAITEARENIVAHYSTEPCVVNALLTEIDRQSAELCAIRKAEDEEVAIAELRVRYDGYARKFMLCFFVVCALAIGGHWIWQQFR